MNKLYMLTVACILFCMSISHAQTRYWRGPANGNWNNTANWATTAVAAPGASVPNGAGFTAIFDQGTPLVNVDLGTFSLLSLVVTNNITAKLYSPAAVQLTVVGNGSPDYGLRIDAGSRLEDSAAGNFLFNVIFGNSAQGLVDGTWYFAGNTAFVGGNGSTFTLPGAGATTKVDVNGTMIIGDRAFAASSPNGFNYLYFNAGSEFRIARDGSNSPRAIWATTSTIRITGTQTAGPAINGLVTNSVGNLIFDCPGVTNEIGWALTPNLIIKGNFQILNTNNQNLVLGWASAGGSTLVSYSVGGNMLVSGTSWVTLGNKNTGVDKNIVLQVDGNFEQTGGTFNLRDAIITSALQATELKIKGNFTQTAGVFGCPSTAGSAGAELFFVELNGTTAQTINISSGTIDNANNAVTLRMNNPNGAVLSAPLSVGRISWNTANKGKIVAGSNLFTINNALNDGLAVNSPGANAYIAGPVARRTSTAVAHTLPTGTASAYRPVEVIPSAITLSTYQAQYFAGAYATPTAELPLSKVSGAEYWDVQKISGSDAAIRLTLGAAVPGVTAADKLVVAHFNTGTSKWESVKGATGTELSPGNTATGSVTSEVLSSFSPFTFGVLPGSPLPVFLVSFNARKISNTAAKLDWIITTNSNPDKFEILRSEDGSHFSAIGTVKAAAQQLTFTYQDNQLPKKTAYYQLRMIDQQGVVTMSKIVPVFNNAEGWVINSMMPTLVSSQAKLNISASSGANLRLAVTDMYGRVVFQQQSRLAAGSQDVWLNLSMLPAGAYQVTGVLDNGLKTGSVRFVKQ